MVFKFSSIFAELNLKYTTSGIHTFGTTEDDKVLGSKFNISVTVSVDSFSKVV